MSAVVVSGRGGEGKNAGWQKSGHGRRAVVSRPTRREKAAAICRIHACVRAVEYSIYGGRGL